MENKKNIKKNLYALICAGCGERYSLRDFSKKNPLEVCGECGCEYFLPYSRDCMKGFTSLEHYVGLLDILPVHLRDSLPAELSPSLSLFRK